MNKPLQKLTALAFFGLLLFMPSVSSAEKVIGVIMTGDADYYKAVHKAFTEELQKSGIKAEVLVQTPAPQTMAWVNAVRKLIAINADVIVTFGGPITLTAVGETSSIPVIYACVFDPEAMGLKDKSNATGISSKVPIQGIVKMLKSIAPFTKLAVVYNKDEKDTVLQAKAVQELGPKMQFETVLVNVETSASKAAFGNSDAIFVTTSCNAAQCSQSVLSAARALKAPTAAAMGGMAEKGVVLTVSANPDEQGQEAARILSRVMSGEKPMAIQILQPKKIDLVVNLREAKELGLNIPFDLLTSATNVIK